MPPELALEIILNSTEVVIDTVVTGKLSKVALVSNHLSFTAFLGILMLTHSFIFSFFGLFSICARVHNMSLIYHSLLSAILYTLCTA